MKRSIMLFAIVAAFCAVGAYAQAPSAAPAAAPAPTPDQIKDQKKVAWENGVKTDCAAEIAPGGICGGKDFSTGLEKCLHQNRAKLSDGCKATVHPRHHKNMKKTAAPAAAPEQAPASTPQ